MPVTGAPGWAGALPCAGPRLDDTVRVLAQGCARLPDKRRALGRRTVPTRLAGMPAFVDVPEQDLGISLRRIPARPADGVVLDVRGTS